MKFYNFNYKFVNGEYIIKEKYESKVKIKHHLYLGAKNKEYYFKCTCMHNNNDFRDLTNWTKIDYSKTYECNHINKIIVVQQINNICKHIEFSNIKALKNICLASNINIDLLGLNYYDEYFKLNYIVNHALANLTYIPFLNFCIYKNSINVTTSPAIYNIIMKNNIYKCDCLSKKICCHIKYFQDNEVKKAKYIELCIMLANKFLIN